MLLAILQLVQSNSSKRENQSFDYAVLCCVFIALLQVSRDSSVDGDMTSTGKFILNYFRTTTICMGFFLTQPKQDFSPLSVSS